MTKEELMSAITGLPAETQIYKINDLLWRDIVRPAILVGKYRLYPRIPCL